MDEFIIWTLALFPNVNFFGASPRLTIERVPQVSRMNYWKRSLEKFWRSSRENFGRTPEESFIWILGLFPSKHLEESPRWTLVNTGRMVGPGEASNKKAERRGGWLSRDGFSLNGQIYTIARRKETQKVSQEIHGYVYLWKIPSPSMQLMRWEFHRKSEFYIFKFPCFWNSKKCFKRNFFEIISPQVSS